MLRTLKQSRFDNSRDAPMIALTSVDLLILDDFALEPMSKEESKDVLSRHSDFSWPRRCSLLCSAVPAVAGGHETSQVSGQPLCRCAGLKTPVEGDGRDPGLAARRFDRLLSPSASSTASASTRLRLSGLDAAANAPAVYASQPPSRADHAKLASDWRPPTLSVGTLTPGSH
jgi:hypothetical protein